MSLNKRKILKCVNITGLCLGMIGSAMLFKWGFPQPSFESGGGMMAEGNTVLEDGRTVDQHEKDSEHERSRYELLSKLGLSFIFVGFLCQAGVAIFD